MTRIAVFCDGTWNSPDNIETTHVRKLYKAVLNDPRQDQVAVYFEGVGNDERFDGPMQAMMRKYGGGAFGWGLEEKVKQAYEFIARVYKPGDEIFLFGFSRGAFTARSVAGMLRKCGISDDTSPDGINRAFALYRRRGQKNSPDKPHILEERRAISPRFATSGSDLDWRRDDSALVNVAYVGVWDTVGARGVPVAVLGPLAAIWNAQYKFHDMALSSMVRAARHAVALDEMRVFYRPALWDNLDRLNSGKTGGERRYQQLWFVGNHGVVGGSGDAQALAAITGGWILSGAAGLIPDPTAIYPPVPPDPMQETHEVAPKRGWFKAWRKGPARRSEIHDTVDARRSGRSDYAPGSLRRMTG